MIKLEPNPGGSDGTESACNAGDLGSVPWSGRFPGEEDKVDRIQMKQDSNW